MTHIGPPVLSVEDADALWDLLQGVLRGLDAPLAASQPDPVPVATPEAVEPADRGMPRWDAETPMLSATWPRWRIYRTRNAVAGPSWMTIEPSGHGDRIDFHPTHAEAVAHVARRTQEGR